MTEHTKWIALPSIDPQWKVCRVESEFDILCLTSQGDDEAKAKEIADAVNNHKALVEALEEAKVTIKALHGPNAWGIYEQHSPEMKKINGALEAAQQGESK